MNSEESPSSKSQQLRMDVRSWYLIGFVSLVIALLIFGECFALNFSMSSELRSHESPLNSATNRGDAQVLSRHSMEGLKSVNEL